MVAFVRYEIGEQIAIGGMGEIYEGFRLDSDGARTPVAFKQIRAELARNEGAAQQFIHEAQLCTMLQHPNLVSGLGLHRDEQGRLLLVMEYVDGVELTALRARPRLSESAAVYVIRGILRALAHVHARGIVHLDVSPHNVVLGRDGAVKLVDFGISRYVNMQGPGERTVQGKPRYLAPEQLLGMECDARADLYAVGVMLYELLTGAVPLGADAESMDEVLGHVMCGSLVPPRELRPELSPGVESVVLRLLAHDPDERYATAEAVLDDLSGEGDGSEIIALVRELAAEPHGAAPELLHAALSELPAVGADDGLAEASQAAPGPELEPRTQAAPSPSSTPGRVRGRWWLALAAALGIAVGGLLVVALSRPGPVSSPHEVREPLPAPTVPIAAQPLLSGPSPGEPLSMASASDEQNERSSGPAARKSELRPGKRPEFGKQRGAGYTLWDKTTPSPRKTSPWEAP